MTHNLAQRFILQSIYRQIVAKLNRINSKPRSWNIGIFRSNDLFSPARFSITCFCDHPSTLGTLAENRIAMLA